MRSWQSESILEAVSNLSLFLTLPLWYQDPFTVYISFWLCFVMQIFRCLQWVATRFATECCCKWKHQGAAPHPEKEMLRLGDSQHNYLLHFNTVKKRKGDKKKHLPVLLTMDSQPLGCIVFNSDHRLPVNIRHWSSHRPIHPSFSFLCLFHEH